MNVATWRSRHEYIEWEEAEGNAEWTVLMKFESTCQVRSSLTRWDLNGHDLCNHRKVSCWPRNAFFYNADWVIIIRVIWFDQHEQRCSQQLVRATHRNRWCCDAVMLHCDVWCWSVSKVQRNLSWCGLWFHRMESCTFAVNRSIFEWFAIREKSMSLIKEQHTQLHSLLDHWHNIKR